VINGEKWIHMLFLGEYQVSFSGPGRILLPKKMRELLKGTSFVLTRGFNQCLAGYDSVEYEQKAKELFSSSILDSTQISERRMLFASTVYVEIDEQGRFVIPKTLQEYGKLSKKVVIVGVGDHFELWDESAWESYKNSIQTT
jgi:MraZ protein